jgi:hypothetical protein
LRELVVVQQPVAVAIAQLPPGAGGFAQNSPGIFGATSMPMCLSVFLSNTNFMPQILAILNLHQFITYYIYNIVMEASIVELLKI